MSSSVRSFYTPGRFFDLRHGGGSDGGRGDGVVKSRVGAAVVVVAGAVSAAVCVAVITTALVRNRRRGSSRPETSSIDGRAREAKKEAAAHSDLLSSTEEHTRHRSLSMMEKEIGQQQQQQQQPQVGGGAANSADTTKVGAADQTVMTAGGDAERLSHVVASAIDERRDGNCDGGDGGASDPCRALSPLYLPSVLRGIVRVGRSRRRSRHNTENRKNSNSADDNSDGGDCSASSPLDPSNSFSLSSSSSSLVTALSLHDLLLYALAEVNPIMTKGSSAAPIMMGEGDAAMNERATEHFQPFAHDATNKKRITMGAATQRIKAAAVDYLQHCHHHHHDHCHEEEADSPSHGGPPSSRQEISNATRRAVLAKALADAFPLSAYQTTVNDDGDIKADNNKHSPLTIDALLLFRNNKEKMMMGSKVKYLSMFERLALYAQSNNHHVLEEVITEDVDAADSTDVVDVVGTIDLIGFEETLRGRRALGLAVLSMAPTALLAEAAVERGMRAKNGSAKIRRKRSQRRKKRTEQHEHDDAPLPSSSPPVSTQEGALHPAFGQGFATAMRNSFALLLHRVVIASLTYRRLPSVTTAVGLKHGGGDCREEACSHSTAAPPSSTPTLSPNLQSSIPASTVPSNNLQPNQAGTFLLRRIRRRFRLHADAMKPNDEKGDSGDYFHARHHHHHCHHSTRLSHGRSDDAGKQKSAAPHWIPSSSMMGAPDVLIEAAHKSMAVLYNNDHGATTTPTTTTMSAARVSEWASPTAAAADIDREHHEHAARDRHFNRHHQHHAQHENRLGARASALTAPASPVGYWDGSSSSRDHGSFVIDYSSASAAHENGISGGGRRRKTWASAAGPSSSSHPTPSIVEGGMQPSPSSSSHCFYNDYYSSSSSSSSSSSQTSSLRGTNTEDDNCGDDRISAETDSQADHAENDGDGGMRREESSFISFPPSQQQGQNPMGLPVLRWLLWLPPSVGHRVVQIGVKGIAAAATVTSGASDLFARRREVDESDVDGHPEAHSHDHHHDDDDDGGPPSPLPHHLHNLQGPREGEVLSGWWARKVHNIKCYINYAGHALRTVDVKIRRRIGNNREGCDGYDDEEEGDGRNPNTNTTAIAATSPDAVTYASRHYYSTVGRGDEKEEDERGRGNEAERISNHLPPPRRRRVATRKLIGGSSLNDNTLANNVFFSGGGGFDAMGATAAGPSSFSDSHTILLPLTGLNISITSAALARDWVLEDPISSYGIDGAFPVWSREDAKARQQKIADIKSKRKKSLSIIDGHGQQMADVNHQHRQRVVDRVQLLLQTCSLANKGGGESDTLRRASGPTAGTTARNGMTSGSKSSPSRPTIATPIECSSGTAMCVSQVAPPPPLASTSAPATTAATTTTKAMAMRTAVPRVGTFSSLSMFDSHLLPGSADHSSFCSRSHHHHQRQQNSQISSASENNCDLGVQQTESTQAEPAQQQQKEVAGNAPRKEVLFVAVENASAPPPQDGKAVAVEKEPIDVTTTNDPLMQQKEVDENHGNNAEGADNDYGREGEEDEGYVFTSASESYTSVTATSPSDSFSSSTSSRSPSRSSPRGVRCDDSRKEKEEDGGFLNAIVANTTTTATADSDPANSSPSPSMKTRQHSTLLMSSTMKCSSAVSSPSSPNASFYLTSSSTPAAAATAVTQTPPVELQFLQEDLIRRSDTSETARKALLNFGLSSSPDTSGQNNKGSEPSSFITNDAASNNNVPPSFTKPFAAAQFRCVSDVTAPLINVIVEDLLSFPILCPPSASPPPTEQQASHPPSSKAATGPNTNTSSSRLPSSASFTAALPTEATITADSYVAMSSVKEEERFEIKALEHLEKYLKAATHVLFEPDPSCLVETKRTMFVAAEKHRGTEVDHGAEEDRDGEGDVAQTAATTAPSSSSSPTSIVDGHVLDLLAFVEKEHACKKAMEEEIAAAQRAAHEAQRQALQQQQQQRQRARGHHHHHHHHHHQREFPSPASTTGGGGGGLLTPRTPSILWEATCENVPFASSSSSKHNPQRRASATTMPIATITAEQQQMGASASSPQQKDAPSSPSALAAKSDGRGQRRRAFTTAGATPTPPSAHPPHLNPPGHPHHHQQQQEHQYQLPSHDVRGSCREKTLQQLAAMPPSSPLLGSIKAAAHNTTLHHHHHTHHHQQQLTSRSEHDDLQQQQQRRGVEGPLSSPLVDRTAYSCPLSPSSPFSGTNSFFQQQQQGSISYVNFMSKTPQTPSLHTRPLPTLHLPPIMKGEGGGDCVQQQGNGVVDSTTTPTPASSSVLSPATLFSSTPGEGHTTKPLSHTHTPTSTTTTPPTALPAGSHSSHAAATPFNLSVATAPAVRMQQHHTSMMSSPSSPPPPPNHTSVSVSFSSPPQARHHALSSQSVALNANDNVNREDDDADDDNDSIRQSNKEALVREAVVGTIGYHLQYKREEEAQSDYLGLLKKAAVEEAEAMMAGEKEKQRRDCQTEGEANAVSRALLTHPSTNGEGEEGEGSDHHTQHYDDKGADIHQQWTNPFYRDPLPSSPPSSPSSPSHVAATNTQIEEEQLPNTSTRLSTHSSPSQSSSSSSPHLNPLTALDAYRFALAANPQRRVVSRTTLNCTYIATITEPSGGGGGAGGRGGGGGHHHTDHTTSTSTSTTVRTSRDRAASLYSSSAMCVVSFIVIKGRLAYVVQLQCRREQLTLEKALPTYLSMVCQVVSQVIGVRLEAMVSLPRIFRHKPTIDLIVGAPAKEKKKDQHLCQHATAATAEEETKPLSSSSSSLSAVAMDASGNCLQYEVPILLADENHTAAANDNSSAREQTLSSDKKQQKTEQKKGSQSSSPEAAAATTATVVVPMFWNKAVHLFSDHVMRGDTMKGEEREKEEGNALMESSSFSATRRSTVSSSCRSGGTLDGSSDRKNATMKEEVPSRRMPLSAASSSSSLPSSLSVRLWGEGPPAGESVVKSCALLNQTPTSTTACSVDADTQRRLLRTLLLVGHGAPEEGEDDERMLFPPNDSSPHHPHHHKHLKQHMDGLSKAVCCGQAPLQLYYPWLAKSLAVLEYLSVSCPFAPLMRRRDAGITATRPAEDDGNRKAAVSGGDTHTVKEEGRGSNDEHANEREETSSKAIARKLRRRQRALQQRERDVEKKKNKMVVVHNDDRDDAAVNQDGKDHHLTTRATATRAPLPPKQQQRQQQQREQQRQAQHFAASIEHISFEFAGLMSDTEKDDPNKHDGSDNDDEEDEDNGTRGSRLKINSQSKDNSNADSDDTDEVIVDGSRFDDEDEGEDAECIMGTIPYDGTVNGSPLRASLSISVPTTPAATATTSLLPPHTHHHSDAMMGGHSPLGSMVGVGSGGGGGRRRGGGAGGNAAFYSSVPSPPLSSSVPLSSSNGNTLIDGGVRGIGGGVRGRLFLDLDDEEEEGMVEGGETKKPLPSFAPSSFITVEDESNGSSLLPPQQQAERNEDHHHHRRHRHHRTRRSNLLSSSLTPQTEAKKTLIAQGNHTTNSTNIISGSAAERSSVKPTHHQSGGFSVREATSNTTVMQAATHASLHTNTRKEVAAGGYRVEASLCAFNDVTQPLATIIVARKRRGGGEGEGKDGVSHEAPHKDHADTAPLTPTNTNDPSVTTSMMKIKRRCQQDAVIQSAFDAAMRAYWDQNIKGEKSTAATSEETHPHCHNKEELVVDAYAFLPLFCRALVEGRAILRWERHREDHHYHQHDVVVCDPNRDSCDGEVVDTLYRIEMKMCAEISASASGIDRGPYPTAMAAASSSPSLQPAFFSSFSSLPFPARSELLRSLRCPSVADPSSPISMAFGGLLTLKKKKKKKKRGGGEDERSSVLTGNRHADASSFCSHKNNSRANNNNGRPPCLIVFGRRDLSDGDEGDDGSRDDHGLSSCGPSFSSYCFVIVVGRGSGYSKGEGGNVGCADDSIACSSTHAYAAQISISTQKRRGGALSHPRKTLSLPPFPSFPSSPSPSSLSRLSSYLSSSSSSSSPRVHVSFLHRPTGIAYRLSSSAEEDGTVSYAVRVAGKHHRNSHHQHHHHHHDHNRNALFVAVRLPPTVAAATYSMNPLWPNRVAFYSQLFGAQQQQLAAPPVAPPFSATATTATSISLPPAADYLFGACSDFSDAGLMATMRIGMRRVPFNAKTITTTTNTQKKKGLLTGAACAFGNNGASSFAATADHSNTYGAELLVAAEADDDDDAATKTVVAFVRAAAVGRAIASLYPAYPHHCTHYTVMSKARFMEREAAPRSEGGASGRGEKGAGTYFRSDGKKGTSPPSTAQSAKDGTAAAPPSLMRAGGAAGYQHKHTPPSAITSNTNTSVHSSSTTVLMTMTMSRSRPFNHLHPPSSGGGGNGGSGAIGASAAAQSIQLMHQRQQQQNGAGGAHIHNNPHISSGVRGAAAAVAVTDRHGRPIRLSATVTSSAVMQKPFSPPSPSSSAAAAGAGVGVSSRLTSPPLLPPPPPLSSLSSSAGVLVQGRLPPSSPSMVGEGRGLSGGIIPMAAVDRVRGEAEEGEGEEAVPTTTPAHPSRPRAMTHNVITDVDDSPTSPTTAQHYFSGSRRIQSLYQQAQQQRGLGLGLSSVTPSSSSLPFFASSLLTSSPSMAAPHTNNTNSSANANDNNSAAKRRASSVFYSAPPLPPPPPPPLSPSSPPPSSPPSVGGSVTPVVGVSGSHNAKKRSANNDAATTHPTTANTKAVDSSSVPAASTTTHHDFSDRGDGATLMKGGAEGADANKAEGEEEKGPALAGGSDTDDAVAGRRRRASNNTASQQQQQKRNHHDDDYHEDEEEEASRTPSTVSTPPLPPPPPLHAPPLHAPFGLFGAHKEGIVIPQAEFNTMMMMTTTPLNHADNDHNQHQHHDRDDHDRDGLLPQSAADPSAYASLLHDCRIRQGWGPVKREEDADRVGDGGVGSMPKGFTSSSPSPPSVPPSVQPPHHGGHGTLPSLSSHSHSNSAAVGTVFAPSYIDPATGVEWYLFSFPSSTSSSAAAGGGGEFVLVAVAPMSSSASSSPAAVMVNVSWTRPAFGRGTAGGGGGSSVFTASSAASDGQVMLRVCGSGGNGSGGSGTASFDFGLIASNIRIPPFV